MMAQRSFFRWILLILRANNFMETVVPGALQRLRAADIVRMAGLTAASQGQEYCRSGVIHSTQRQGSSLSGVVQTPHSGVSEVESGISGQTRHYRVEVILQSASSWTRHCTCDAPPSLLCAHGAALLYQWLAHPEAFVLSSSQLPQAVPAHP